MTLKYTIRIFEYGAQQTLDQGIFGQKNRVHGEYIPEAPQDRCQSMH